MSTTEHANFDGLRVLTLESRRATEMERLIERQGGVATVAPSMREVPIEENPAVLEFADDVANGVFDMVIWMTGVGARYLANVVEERGQLPALLAGLRQTTTIARGPKPVAVLRELEIPIALVAPSPNTWREVLEILDANAEQFPLLQKRVAVQEYGVANGDLVAELQARGAQVTGIPVYKWALPFDLEPLHRAIDDLCAGRQDVVLFTTGTQLWHLLQVAESQGKAAEVKEGLKRTVIASVGPTTTEALRECGLEPDLEPEHPKMGHLVRDAARQSRELLAQKQAVVANSH